MMVHLVFEETFKLAWKDLNFKSQKFRLSELYFHIWLNPPQLVKKV
jgi:hypothetical protein